MTLLRPNTAVVERKQTSGVSNTGTPVPAAPEQVYAALPCLIDAISALRSFELTQADGAQPVTIGGHMIVVDGANITGTPGDTVTVTVWGNPIEMIIAPNGLAAYPDIQKNDRITREDGTEYLVIGVHQYPGVTPNLQAELQLGKAWS
jgi:hypothetical protein